MDTQHSLLKDSKRKSDPDPAHYESKRTLPITVKWSLRHLRKNSSQHAINRDAERGKTSSMIKTAFKYFLFFSDSAVHKTEWGDKWLYEATSVFTTHIKYGLTLWLPNTSNTKISNQCTSSLINRLPNNGLPLHLTPDQGSQITKFIMHAPCYVCRWPSHQHGKPKHGWQ